MKIDRDAFDEWLAHPVTEALMRGLSLAERHIEKTWVAVSLDGGQCDPAALARLRERRQVYREIRALNNETLEEMNDEQD